MQIDHNMEWCVVAGKLKNRVHYMQIDVRRLQDQSLFLQFVYSSVC